MGVVLNVIVMVVDPIAAGMLFYIFFAERNRFFAPLGYRFALTVAIAGLVGQLGWSILVIFANEIMTAATMPWWVGKDLGYFLFGSTYFYYHHKKRMAK